MSSINNINHFKTSHIVQNVSFQSARFILWHLHDFPDNRTEPSYSRWGYSTSDLAGKCRPIVSPQLYLIEQFIWMSTPSAKHSVKICIRVMQGTSLCCWSKQTKIYIKIAVKSYFIIISFNDATLTIVRQIERTFKVLCFLYYMNSLLQCTVKCV